TMFFFFQAEDGIRDRNVTGVQTCALPIFGGWPGFRGSGGDGAGANQHYNDNDGSRNRHYNDSADNDQLCGQHRDLYAGFGVLYRSEERRVGKEGRWWWSRVY